MKHRESMVDKSLTQTAKKRNIISLWFRLVENLRARPDYTQECYLPSIEGDRGAELGASLPCVGASYSQNQSGSLKNPSRLCAKYANKIAQLEQSSILTSINGRNSGFGFG